MPDETSFTIAGRFLAAAAAGPDRIALEAGGRALTYAELRGLASGMAREMQAAGVGRDSVVVLAGVRSIDYVAAMLAVALAGGAYLPVAPDTPPARLAAVLETARPQIVLADEQALALFAARPGGAMMLDALAGAADRGAAPPPCPATPDSLAYVMFTSGSTGVPKGAAITQTAVVQLVCDTNYIILAPGNRVLLHSALTFDAVTFEIWGPLLNGGTLVVMPAGKPRLQDYAVILSEQRIDTAFFTPALFREQVDRDPTGLAPLRYLLTGGEVVAAHHVRRALEANPGLRVIVVYGPTECTTFATTCEFADATGVPDPLPLGPAVAATDVWLLAEDGRAAAVGETGEIYIGGPRIGRGYLGRPDLTEAAFVQLDGQRVYRTGDLAVRDPRGDLFFRGRRDRQIKLRGYRVELEEIESNLRAHPMVAAAAVKLLESDGARDPMLIAYVTPNADAAAAAGTTHDAADALTDEWRDLYSDLLYRGLAAPDQAGADPTFNTAGWKNSYDGRHIDDAQMLEQVGQTVERVLAAKPTRVLEIGCGTGMLLFRIAPHCQAYVGTDFSPVAIDYVTRQLETEKLGDIVTLACCPAHNLPEAPGGGFDMVVINSVTEHFPSIDYLDGVLRQLRAKLAADAHVFIGDNRNHTLLPLFHASVQLFRSEGAMPTSRFALQVAQAVAEERQLTINPAYFLQLGEEGYRCVSLQCRRGIAINEMTAFRFDAMLRLGQAVQTASAVVPRASDQPDMTPAIDMAADRSVVIGGVRNARTRGGDLLIEAIGGRSSLPTVADLRHAVQNADDGLSPELVWRSAEARGIAAEVRPRLDCPEGDVDLWLSPQGMEPAAWAAPVRALDALANDPSSADRLAKLAAVLRPYLQQRLPDYAMPSFIVALPSFIATAHGKIDLAALPLPERLRRRRSENRPGVSDSADLAQLRRCWETVLGLHDIEDDENFFELGGNSLKTVRMVAEFKQMSGISLSPAHVFERPTLAGLVQCILDLNAADHARSAEADDRRGQSRRAAVTTRRRAAADAKP